MDDVRMQGDTVKDEEFRRDASDVESLLISRAYMYTLFHKLFGGSATEELLGVLMSDDTLEFVGLYAEDNETMRGFSRFIASLRECDLGRLADKAGDEYTRLLVGPGRPEVLPWESPYRTDDASFFQENTLEVRRIFSESGFVAKRSGHVPDDHVSLLCAFAAESAKSLRALVRDRDLPALSMALRAQEAFVEQHMVNWLDSFALCARKASSAVLIPQTAEALDAFVRIDAEFLAQTAYWSESLASDDRLPSLDAGLSCDAEERSCEQGDFSCAEAALGRLDAVRLFALEENELKKRGE